ncbi:unnamed protein product [Arabidopsis lyrata]|nr:unnamed protein product [Arabidopsis lyrata]
MTCRFAIPINPSFFCLLASHGQAKQTVREIYQTEVPLPPP